MNIYIIIPAYNEEAHIAKTLQSLVEQTILPKKIRVVNDHSLDNTQFIIDSFSKKYTFIQSTTNKSKATHQPGSKVINAFNKGLQAIDEDYDIICKFDADLIFPPNYLEKIVEIFQKKTTCGLVGGFCYVKNNKEWVIENLTNKDHIRGALKAYRKQCFQQIGGLKNTMGWDTVDELLAKYYGWEVCTDETLHVKHLKPTGSKYSKNSKHKQGEAFYNMRYGFTLSVIASAKLAYRKRSISFFIHTMQGYFNAKSKRLPYIVSKKEGEFIRALRWKGIKKKLFLSN